MSALADWRTEVGRLASFLKEQHPANVLMPLVDKHPMFGHKDRGWTWDRFDAWFASASTPCDVGILCQDLLVLDADDAQAVEALESVMPEASTCPAVRTSRGMHYYFKRTEACDANCLFDKAGICRKMDLKTRCSTGTGGVVVCPPSGGKAWVRSLFDTPLPPVPPPLVDALVRALEAMGGGRDAEATSPPLDPGEHEGMVRAVEALLESMGDSSRFRSVACLANGGHTLQFLTSRGGRTCPHGATHHKNNFYVHCHEDGTAWYKCLSSECAHKPLAPIGRWRRLEFLSEEGHGNLHSPSAKPSKDDLAAAQAFLEYMGRRHDVRHIYLGGKARLMWDGTSFVRNDGHEHTSTQAERHYAAICAEYNIHTDMFTKASRWRSVCEMMRGRTFDPAFSDTLDQHVHLMGFANGVLDLHNGEFRPPRFEDRITMSTRINFLTQRDPAQEARVHKILEDIYPCKAVRDFNLTLIASCLEGYNTCQVGPFWVGSGRNGKSLMANFCGAMFGDYAGVLEPGQFTSNMQGGAANSQLVSVMKKRIVFVSEPETGGKAKMNWETYKRLTGKDELQLRDLYDKPKTFLPHPTPFFLFNNLPCGDDDSAGAKERVKCVPHESRFVADPKLPFEKPINPRLSDEFPALAPHFFNILYHDYYTPFRQSGYTLHTPDEAKDGAKALIGHVVDDWFAERVVQRADGFMTLKQVRQDFFDYWSEHQEDKTRFKGVTAEAVKARVSSILNMPCKGQKRIAGRNETNVWVGFEILPQDPALKKAGGWVGEPCLLG